MLKYLFYLYLLHFVAQIDSKVYRKGPLLDNDIDDSKDESKQQQWQGLWFPHPPNYHHDVNDNVKKVNVANVENKDSIQSWHGLWFPHPPGSVGEQNRSLGSGQNIGDFLSKHECDNGRTNIAIDFDPDDKRHSYNYLCLGNRTKYEPNFNTSALLMEHLVPLAYQPPVRCLSEKITYDESLPTFGPYRPMASKFGSYKYLPPQRWLRSLSDGAIVLLYHPCAFSGQIKQLQNVVQACLYRHIITPSQLLSPERPLAILAWGKCLQMSVVDDSLVVDFIKKNAKLGLQGKKNKVTMSSRVYEAGLLNEAHLVTDDQDLEICGYKEM